MKQEVFTFENQFMKRTLFFENGVPVKQEILNKKNNARWDTDGREAVIALPGIDPDGCTVVREEDTLILRKDDFEIRWEFTVFDDLPVIESRIGIRGKSVKAADITKPSDDVADSFGCPSRNVNLKAVSLFDRSDITNYLLEEKNMPFYGITKCDGQIFMLTDTVTGNALLAVKNVPCADYCFLKPKWDLYAEPITNTHICGCGIDTSDLSEEEFVYSYAVALGVCEKEDIVSVYKAYYNTEYQATPPYIMSNTWGDCNHDSRVSQDFILKEIECAAGLGVDVVQIDDGWQMGITSGSVLQTGGTFENFRNANPDFWKIDRKKFPDGFRTIAEAAKRHNVKLGLWFGPDNYGDYQYWSEDADVLLSFYREYGISYFKLDAIRCVNRECEKNLVKMLSKVRKESGGAVVFNMDITGRERFGYLLHREFGDLFLENRYTDRCSYYPHATLRNLWDLSHYIPAGRFQIEVLNNGRNTELYDDILAPACYDIDYTFALVMAAKPLMWMELSGLQEESAKRLQKIIEVYKRYRDDFLEAEPILERPDGFSLTGFLIRGKERNYLLMLREQSEKCEADYEVKEILATNDPDCTVGKAKLHCQKTYLFGIV